MDEKLWNFATTIGGGTGFFLIAGLIAWKAGIFKWLGTFVDGRISNESVVKANNDVHAEIVKRLTTEVADLKKEIKEMKESHNKEMKELKEESAKELKEKKEAIAGLEAQYDLIASQYREAKRNLAFDEAKLLEDNKQQRQRIMELETELAKARTEIESLKKSLNSGYNPISAD